MTYEEVLRRDPSLAVLRPPRRTQEEIENLPRVVLDKVPWETHHGIKWTTELVEQIRAYQGTGPIQNYMKLFLDDESLPLDKSFDCGCSVKIRPYSVSSNTCEHREHAKGSRSKQCGKKEKLPDEAEAIRVRDKMATNWQRPFNAYLCPWCGSWHVGSAHP